MDEIAGRSGVSAPVVYDHFASKQDLHVHLLERHYAGLREVWREHLAGDDPLRAAHAARRSTRGSPTWRRTRMRRGCSSPTPRATPRSPRATATCRRAAARWPCPSSRASRAPRASAGSADAEAMEMAWEVFRAVLQGLALWWNEHPDVPRAQVVATAMNALWVGFERVRRGERWEP